MDENHPMLSRPIHFQLSATGFDAERKPMKGSGIVTTDTASNSSTTGQPGVSVASAGNSRIPM